MEAYGTTFYVYQFVSLFDKIDPDEGAFNWQFKPYVNVGNFQFDLGYARFGGNELINRPTYGYRYLIGIVYEAYGAKDAKVHFGVYIIFWSNGRFMVHLLTQILRSVML